MAADKWVVRANAYARILFSVVVLIFAIYILAKDNFTGDGAKWATGIIGFVLGYWLK